MLTLFFQPLSKINYRGDYHSVGLLEFSSTDKQPFSVIFDLTYGNVSGKDKRNTIQAFYFSGDREQAAEILKNHYGGSWTVDYELDKKTGNFVYCEKPKESGRLAA